MTATDLDGLDGLDVRTPPSDVVAETAVLGACLTSPRAIEDTLDTGITAADWYRPAHEVVWAAIRRLHDTREPVDAITVVNELRRTGDLARAGGPVAIADLLAGVVSSATAAHHATIVRDLATLRRLTAAATRISQIAHAGGDADAAVAAAQTEVGRVADSRVIGAGLALPEVARRALTALADGGTQRAVPTPWPSLTHLVEGARPCTLIVTGARPGIGKTIFAVQWAFAHATAIRATGGQVAYFTLEMSPERLYQRALATASGVDARAIARGVLTEDDEVAVLTADARVQTLPVTIEGASGWTAQQIRARVRQLHRERPVSMVVVDHIGLTRGDRASRDVNRQAELSAAADLMLALAHDVDACVHLVTQLNRGVTQRSDQRPVPSDIRDTDRLEQNADVVLLLHRDKDRDPSELHVAVAKNRDGLEGSCRLDFDGSRSRISEPRWSPSALAVTP